MDKEAAPVIAQMSSVSEKIICGKKVVKGKLYGEKTAVLICGVGKVNAACGTQIAISKFKPEAVINLGVAGGLNDGVRVGEIY